MHVRCHVNASNIQIVGSIRGVHRGLCWATAGIHFSGRQSHVVIQGQCWLPVICTAGGTTASLCLHWWGTDTIRRSCVHIGHLTKSDVPPVLVQPEREEGSRVIMPFKRSAETLRCACIVLNINVFHVILPWIRRHNLSSILCEYGPIWIQLECPQNF